MNKLLIDDYPLQVLPKLAKEIGLNEAIFIQQLHYWTNGKSGKLIEGKRWVYNTYEDWQENFPFWSVSTIRRTINSCEKQGYIITGNFNKLGIDKTKWYTINYDTVNRVNSRIVQNEQSRCSEWTDGAVQNEQTITRDYTETTSENNNSPAEDRTPTIPYKLIIDYLNEQTGSKYSHIGKENKKLISGRWNELKKVRKGITDEELVECFKKVIDYKKADADNPSTKFDKKYLRPSTLFRQSNFDTYLNESERKNRELADSSDWKDWLDE